MMKQNPSHIEHIRDAFAKIQTREDLLYLMNEVKPLIYGCKSVPFSLKQLTWHANPGIGGKRYSAFTIKKKSGMDRKIHAPSKGLKSLQKVLSYILQCVFEPHDAAMGFVRNRSVADNAKRHVGQRYVYNIDLKDFFPSIDQARVWKCLQLKPFNLNPESSVKPQFMKWEDFNRDYLKNEDDALFFQGRERMFTSTPWGTLYVAKNFDAGKDKYVVLGNSSLRTKKGDSLEGTLWLVNKIPDATRLEIANTIAALCCTEMEVERKNDAGEWIKVKKNVLPQGAPTSPVITNIICQRLDYLLSAVARRFGLKYSRYADDITFSSMHNVYQPGSEFLNELHRIIVEQGFHIKESKTRLQKDGYRKEVTGLLVNEKVNVQQRYIKQLRMWLYYWERYGYERASSFFMQQYFADKGHVKKGKPEMINVISGKLEYLKMVRGVEDKLYLNLKRRIDAFTDTSSTTAKENIITAGSETNKVRITLEVYQSPELKEKLNNSINIPKDTILPRTIIVPNTIAEMEEAEDVQDDNIPMKLFPHNPMYTVAFLKKFKIGDGSGFKELVHDVILTDETIKEILIKVKGHPNFIYHYNKEWISEVSFLNRAIQKEVIKLIDLFETEGLPFYKNSSRHPFNNDNKYTTFAKQFKKKYRYGSGSEYSKLQSDIISIFNEQHVSVSSLSFMPNERAFNIRSSFFTWQPSIYSGIRYIIQGISDHSNINGVSTFNPDSKKVIVEVERMQAENLSFIELRIFDCMSVAKIDSLTLLQFLKGSSPFKFDFRNLCDWILECDFLDESSKRINLLIAPENSKSSLEIEDLPFTVGGFKHKLRFYDIS